MSAFVSVPSMLPSKSETFIVMNITAQKAKLMINKFKISVEHPTIHKNVTAF